MKPPAEAKSAAPSVKSLPRATKGCDFDLFVLNLDKQACFDYWARHEDMWARPLALLDIQAALLSGELETAAISRIGSLAEAVERLEQGKLDVRRRYRGLTAAALLSRFRLVARRRAQLRARGPAQWAAQLARADVSRAAAALHAVRPGCAPPEFTPLAGAASGTRTADERWLTVALVEAFLLELRELSLFEARELARRVLAKRGLDVAACRAELGLARELSEEAVLDAFAAREVGRERTRRRVNALAGVLALAAAVASSTLAQHDANAAANAMERALEALG